MSTAIQEPLTEQAPRETRETYLNVAHGVASWLFTKDHKRIAILYLLTVTVMFFLGGLAVTIIRLNLMTPEGGLVTADTYNRLFTMHGVIMVFFFLVPVVPTVLGNFCLPLMIGAKDLAFPRINLASWYLFAIGAAWTTYAMIANGLDTGWTFYTPYSSQSTHYNVVPALIGIVISGFSSIFTGLNFIVTVHRLRAPGLYWWRLPLFVWTIYATSFIFLLGVPVLAMAAILVILERLLQIGVFDPALGGDPLLFQHLFWFYSHPAVYIMILPGMGIVSEIIPCFARKNLFGYSAVALASFGIACVGFLVWAHHMFVAGISMYAAMIFSILSYLVAVPSAIKVFNWTATLYKGSISFEAPMLYALGFVCLFTAGGLTGLFLAALGVDMHVHDTYFVIAHFHFIMVGGMVMGYMAGLHYWWPKITGRLYSEWWSRLSAIIIFVGFFFTFLPQFVVGYAGMPRRYHRYPPEYQVWNVMSTAGASILAVGYVLPLLYLLYSLKYGRPAGPNPWRATGLEWQTPSPPPPHNFEATPEVVRGPYEYHVEKAQMRSNDSILTADERAELELTALVRHPLEEHFANLEQQHEVATLGMWVFLATEVMFFGTLFLGVGVYHIQYPEAFEKGSEKLNWLIGGVNTVVLLVSSLFMVLAVHSAGLGDRKRLCLYLGLTALLGVTFLCLKGVEYYIDYLDKLIPGWSFDEAEWIKEGLRPEDVPHVKLFLLFYWIMTGFHALHVTIGIAVVTTMLILAWNGYFTPAYYSPIDVTALYWHFVDLVWIFLLPMLYLLNSHAL